MKKEEFLILYRLNFVLERQDSETLVAITSIINRSTNNFVDGVKTTISIEKANQNISDSQSMISLGSFNWKSYIDQVKKMQLGYLLTGIPIVDFPDLTNDTSEFYI